MDLDFDDLAVESNIYSPTTLRQIYGGKAFKRGVEYHINLLACYFLQFDTIVETNSVKPLKELCINLRDGLHNCDVNVNEIFHELKKYFIENIKDLLDNRACVGLSVFKNNYMNQVECLLNITRACRQINFDEYLAALDQQCRYFFAHDLYHYARLIPVRLAMIEELKHEDTET